MVRLMFPMVLLASVAAAQPAPAVPTPAPTTPTPAAPVVDPTIPALPPAVTAPTVATDVPAPPTTGTIDVAALKAQIKAELQAEMRTQLQAEMQAAAKESALQSAAKQEWAEERWVEEVKPNLNFIELDGYFRAQGFYFSRLDLGTYDPTIGRGTSNFAPPGYYRPFDGAGCQDGAPGNFPGGPCTTATEDTQSILSLNMRLRLDPTLNVSENIRIRSTLDVFDNLVLGSSPESLPGFAQNPTLPLPIFAGSQNPPQAGINSLTDAVRIRRLWFEWSTPIGQLRIGRMPLQFGLGLLANDGNRVLQNYGDNADMVLFATKLGGHIIAPAYSISSSGPFGRIGGLGTAGDNGLGAFVGEQGTRFNLDLKDDVHSFMLTAMKKDSDEDMAAQLKENGFALNYGVFAVYRTQRFDIPSYYVSGEPGGPNRIDGSQYVRRDANAGIGSAWGKLLWNKLTVELEATGVVGQVGGTALTSNGLDVPDPQMRVIENGRAVNRPLWIVQGGVALESSYRVLDDKLVFGFDAGVASGDDAFGMGLRPVVQQNPQAGDADGKQYGQCLVVGDAIDTDGDGFNDLDCITVDDNITNFRFDPDYQVDLIMFREILGTVTDAFYLKPHVGYEFSPQLGARLDIIYSQALYASSTPGLQNPLGIEADIKGWFMNDEGIFIMPQVGALLPLGGLSHYQAVTLSDERFRNPQWAWTFQLAAGTQF